VIVNGKLSTWADLLSGIPQVSALSPILFVNFMTDLPDVVRNTTKIFADDTKLLPAVHIMEDPDILLQVLDNFVKWSHN